jgi:hypothetical protein
MSETFTPSPRHYQGAELKRNCTREGAYRAFDLPSRVTEPVVPDKLGDQIRDSYGREPE